MTNIESKSEYVKSEPVRYESNNLSVTLGKIVGGLFLAGLCAMVAQGLISGSKKDDYISLNDRLKQSYEMCAVVKDKDDKVSYLPISSGKNVSCREVENMYTLVFNNPVPNEGSIDSNHKFDNNSIQFGGITPSSGDDLSELAEWLRRDNIRIPGSITPRVIDFGASPNLGPIFDYGCVNIPTSQYINPSLSLGIGDTLTRCPEVVPVIELQRILIDPRNL